MLVLRELVDGNVDGVPPLGTHASCHPRLEYHVVQVLKYEERDDQTIQGL